MQPSSYYKISGLAERGEAREALAWLAAQLRWERTLERLRAHAPAPARRAA
jgi:hypothetical protein